MSADLLQIGVSFSKYCLLHSSFNQRLIIFSASHQDPLLTAASSQPCSYLDRTALSELTEIAYTFAVHLHAHDSKTLQRDCALCDESGL